MAKSKSATPKKKAAAKKKATVSQLLVDDPPMTVIARADAMFRIASECCRQHRRYAHLVKIEADEHEQYGAMRVVAACDELLIDAGAEYERACDEDKSARGEDWWRRANALWLAAREYARRHRHTETISRQKSAHDSSKFSQLAVEYDLEASALLAMRQAIDAYRKSRPEADFGTARP
jgi:hypothetical protein